ncbi:hypothetical protein C6I20_04950 [Aeromicrobium sp. A1-2]|uniref:hypothetical protein n=1 Tax=Aeromicrobium sp. A1-2 TaxID=2107713 RepID=UPI000E4CD7D7|nr:hypothetical protein [Aeromicrobium sp. A1-2]AXT84605.1 hypothetical protein C6I20_04950 [Aeromicrobium sp. A1-2]
MSNFEAAARASIHDHSMAHLRRAWWTLDEPRLTDLCGTFEATYVGRTLQTVAPRGLALVGLPRWFGKHFDSPDGESTALEGRNLLRTVDGSALTATLPMRATLAASLADGGPALVVTYPADAPRPWRWVRDEFRPWEDSVLLGLTFVDRVGLRHAPGTPFVLRRVTSHPPEADV